MERPSVNTVWQDNYRSAKDQAAELEHQLKECHSKGWALRLEHGEAKRRFPNLVVSSLGAVVKTDPDTGEATNVRMVLDGTHRVALNNQIRVRDQDRCPTASDVRRQQKEQASYTPCVGLAADIKSAHRLPVVDPRDWHSQGCRSDSASMVHVFKVGVFGISSIAYWWARMGGASVRAAHHVTSIESTNRRPAIPILITLLFLGVLGFALSWRKVNGGNRIEWIGYEVWAKELRLGIAASRASWAIDWCRRLARDGATTTAELATGVGRLSFVCGVMEYERPLLPPSHT